MIHLSTAASSEKKQLKSTLGFGNRKTLSAKTNSSWGRLMFEN
jgi:hypothetical protein